MLACGCCGTLLSSDPVCSLLAPFIDCQLTQHCKKVHLSAERQATTPMLMPAMSPTMTEGSISEWKLKEGDSFAAGDVLLSIETDKASIDVEAQDDGIMGKILVRRDSLTPMCY